MTKVPNTIDSGTVFNDAAIRPIYRKAMSTVQSRMIHQGLNAENAISAAENAKENKRDFFFIFPLHLETRYDTIFALSRN